MVLENESFPLVVKGGIFIIRTMKKSHNSKVLYSRRERKSHHLQIKSENSISSHFSSFPMCIDKIKFFLEKIFISIVLNKVEVDLDMCYSISVGQSIEG